MGLALLHTRTIPGSHHLSPRPSRLARSFMPDGRCDHPSKQAIAMLHPCLGRALSSCARARANCGTSVWSILKLRALAGQIPVDRAPHSEGRSFVIRMADMRFGGRPATHGHEDKQMKEQPSCPAARRSRTAVGTLDGKQASTSISRDRFRS